MKAWINYHHLLYFKTIAELGSVSKAAEQLSLGQPALSAQLKQFEEQLGVQLFERQHKKLILTEQGRVALVYAKNIFTMGNEMLEVINDKLKPGRVQLTIGAIDSIPKHIIAQISKAALRVGPCQISIFEGRSDEILRELTAHRIDLFVSNYLPNSLEARGLHHRIVLKNAVGIYGAPEFKNLKKNFPNSLSGQKFILPTYDSKLRYDFEHWSNTRNLSLDIVAETQDASLKKIMATEKMGLIPIATHSVQKELKTGELIEIGKMDGVIEELFLISGQRKIENSIAAWLMKNFTI